MDKGTDRSRAFHGIGQPDVQREHGTLTGTADEHQSKRQRQQHAAFHQLFLFGSEGEGSHIETVNQDTDKEAQIGETGYDERFLAGSDSLGLRVIESDEQVRRHTHQFPEHVHLEDVGGEHQSQHREREERQERIVALEADFAFHVTE